MKKLLLLTAVFIYCLQITYAQLGQLDVSFGNQGIVKTDIGSPYNDESSARQVLQNPDGSILILLDAASVFVSKRLTNGSVDSTYGIGGYSRSVPLSDAFAALQQDGKIVIAGSLSDGTFGVARINANGLPDLFFGNNGIQSATLNPRAVAIQADGKIVIAGFKTTGKDTTYFSVVRYSSDGSPDNTFNGNGQVITGFGFKLPPDSKEGDSVEVNDAHANSVAIQSDGKILAGGYVSTGKDEDFGIIRYNVNGSLDNTFDKDGRQTTSFGSADFGYSLAVQTDGKPVLAGYSNNRFAVVRYNINGSIDNSFSGDGKQIVNLTAEDVLIGNSVGIQSNGKIVISGYTFNGADNDFAVTRFKPNGSVDNSFGKNGILTTDFNASNDFARSMILQNDKIILAGNAYIDNTSHFVVTRYTANGSLDNTFDNDGKLVGNFAQGSTVFNSAAIQADGKTVTAGFTWNGSNYEFAVVRYNTNGSIDNTFSADGKQISSFNIDAFAYSVAIQSDGKIVVGGYSNLQFAVVRYNTNGSLDNTFSGDGELNFSMGFSDILSAVSIQSDGKIVMTGFTFIDANYDSAVFAIARLNTNGTLDNTFSEDGKQLTDFGTFKNSARAAAIQKDGKIVIAGSSNINGKNNFSLCRYNTDGSLDTAFSHDGKQNNVFGGDAYTGTSLAIQNNGKILLAGFSESGASSSYAIARYNINGELDNSFSDDGFQSAYVGTHSNFAHAVAINTDGRIALGGTNDNFTVVLLNEDGSFDNTFSLDGIQTTNIGVGNSTITSLAFAGNKLYAAGFGQFPGTLGVVARYVLAEAGPLPVSLMSFKAVLQNQSVLLQWIVSEKNVTRFVIERSADGNTFSPINDVIARTASTLNGNYSVVDEQPFQNINFYRLKMFDADGKFTYSSIVAVKINGVNKLHIFPNPARDILFVQASGNNEAATIEISDATAKKLKEVKVVLSPNTSISINVQSLPAGIYHLILRKKDKTEAQTFIKK